MTKALKGYFSPGKLAKEQTVLPPIYPKGDAGMNITPAGEVSAAPVESEPTLSFTA